MGPDERRSPSETSGWLRRLARVAWPGHASGSVAHPVRPIEASRGHMLMGSSLPLVPHVKMSLEGSIGCLTKDVLEISVQENFFPTEG
jgi:hypothetical protein